MSVVVAHREKKGTSDFVLMTSTGLNSPIVCSFLQVSCTKSIVQEHPSPSVIGAQDERQTTCCQLCSSSIVSSLLKTFEQLKNCFQSMWSYNLYTHAETGPSRDYNQQSNERIPGCYTIQGIKYCAPSDTYTAAIYFYM